MSRKEFTEGGDRIRWTFPPLIVSAIKLARRYKYCESTVTSWDSKISTLFKFIHQCTSLLYNRVESSDICLRLYLLSLSSADEAGLEELAYEFAVQAFTIYEESISESRAQLQAITLIVGTLQTTRVFGTDNYDTLITKAALHGAKLLKKGQQATAVALASHLWWQTEVVGREGGVEDKSSTSRSLSTAPAPSSPLTPSSTHCTKIETIPFILPLSSAQHNLQTAAHTAFGLSSVIQLLLSRFLKRIGIPYEPPVRCIAIKPILVPTWRVDLRMGANGVLGEAGMQFQYRSGLQ
ncbi:hypothetical protein P7C70_g9103, partial [Phenoliferia sp. Uapishka_3]